MSVYINYIISSNSNTFSAILSIIVLVNWQNIINKDIIVFALAKLVVVTKVLAGLN
jgi:hypothetical protein